MSGHRHTTPSAPRVRRRLVRRLAIPAVVATAAALLVVSQPASAGIVPTVALATSANYSVLGGQSVSNTGPSILGQSLGLDPGPLSAVTGFPPGTVLAPGTIAASDGVTLQAQSDLTAAYIDAFNRPVEFTQTNPDLVGQTLAPGVYAGTSKAPLSLSGQLVLDGQGNNNAVFIFQTDSTLITSSASTIELINGASECNVFWQVGSSATLGTGSVFVGNIMALTSISVQTGVVVHGRALARNGSVTLDNDVFTQPSCVPATATQPPATTTTTTATTATTTPAGGVTTIPGPATTATPGATVAPTVPGPGFGDTDITLPRTGGHDVTSTSMIGGFVLVLGAAAIVLARRRRPAV
jgi:LPXTG-motif cell wall-anchored protein